MDYIIDSIFESSRNDSNPLLVTDSNGPIKYRRKCNYVRPEIITTSCKEEFEFISDANSLNGNEGLKKKSIISAQINYEGFSLENDILNIYGPSLLSECLLSGIEQADYDREIGFIQFSKTFFERTYGELISRVDFLENLLNNKEVVLDCDGENNPFYSKESYCKVLAGEIPPDEIKLRLFDCPSSETPLLVNGKNLDNVERYQQFFVYLVMRYWVNEEWKYKISLTFDWFIYCNWSTNNNYQCEYGIIQHKSVLDLPKIKIYATCNKNQFIEWMKYLLDDPNVNLNTIGRIHAFPSDKICFQILDDCENSETLFFYNFGCLENLKRYQEELQISNNNAIIPSQRRVEYVQINDDEFYDIVSGEIVPFSSRVPVRRTRPNEITLKLYCCPNIDIPYENKREFSPTPLKNFKITNLILIVSHDLRGGKPRIINAFERTFYFHLDHGIYEYECRINRHKSFRDLPIINTYRSCNDDQFIHFIDGETNHFDIFNYPDYRIEKEIFLEIITKSNRITPNYPEICIFVLLGYKDNGEWKYAVLHTFDPWIYLAWFHRFIGRDCEISRHKTLRQSPELYIYWPRNKEQFFRWLDLENSKFNIFYWPDFQFVKETFRKKIKSAVILSNSRKAVIFKI